MSVGPAGRLIDAQVWGFGVGMVTRREHPAAPVGQAGWDGGLGTSWRDDQSEDLAASF